MKRTLLLFASALLLASGCSSVVNSHRQKEPLAAAYLAGDHAKAAAETHGKLRDSAWFNTSVVGTGDELVWRLEAGSLAFDAGKYSKCIDEFKQSELLIAAYDERARVSVRDLSAETVTVFTNLNALPYRGFGRDRVMLAFYKSLAYLGRGDEEAFRAQLRRLRTEQKKIEEDYRAFLEEEKRQAEKDAKFDPEAARKAKDQSAQAQHSKDSQNKEFQKQLKILQEKAKKGYGILLNPAALYLSGLGSWRDGNLDNALIDFRRLYLAMPQSALAQRYYATLLRQAGRAVPPELQRVPSFDFSLDRGCLYVFFANGRGPALQQTAIYFPLMTAWPMCEFYAAPFREMTVTADRRRYRTEQLADLDAVFAQEFNERLPGIITRTIFNTLVKEGAYYGSLIAIAASNMDAGTKTALLCGIGIAGLFYRTALNTADTRSWELLPKEFQLTQLPLPRDGNVTIVLSGRGRSVTQQVQLPSKCRSAILFVNAPSREHVTVHVLPITNQ